MTAVTHIDQFLAGFSAGDAISNEALILQKFLRERGFQSEIFCEQFTDRDSERVRHYKSYHQKRDAILIYHHSFFSGMVERLPGYPARKVLIFHNITPSQYVIPYNRGLAQQLEKARNGLAKLASIFDVILADSRYNADELRKLGFEKTEILPVAIDFSVMDESKDPAYLDFLRDGKTNVLFVGRIFPNKRHQDLIKTFYFFHRIRPASRLICAGTFHPAVKGYTGELNNLTAELGLTEHVIFTGMAPQKDITAYYRNSHIFLSMSGHEGFFVPILESMHFQLPILALGSSVVPETMSGAGIIFNTADPLIVAELMEKTITDNDFRAKIIAGQNVRLKDYSVDKILSIFSAIIDRMLV